MSAGPGSSAARRAKPTPAQAPPGAAGRAGGRRRLRARRAACATTGGCSPRRCARGHRVQPPLARARPRRACAARACRGARVGGVRSPRSSTAERPTRSLLHYSVLRLLGHRGVPRARRTRSLAALRRSRAAGRRGHARARLPVRPRRGCAALLWATHASGSRCSSWCAPSRASVATTEERADGCVPRRWLPRRPVAFAPVFSNLPAPARAGRARPAPRRRSGR